MKPTIKVSIGGIAFNLEEAAYHLLKQYLDRLHAHYEKFDGRKEIVEDIELRIAELLRERIRTQEQAVSEIMVNEVIAILGQPEEFEKEDGSSSANFSSINKKQTTKKLYRDVSNKVLGGVCSGLATYFNMDAVLMRVIFVVLFVGFSALNWMFLGITGGFVALVYIALWIIMPAANTVQQRHEMRGEKPDLKNIQRKVEEELREAGRAIQKNAPALNEVAGTMIKIFGIFFGIIAIIIALSVLLAFVIAFATGFSVVNMLSDNLLAFVNINWHPEWFFGLLATLIFLPFIGLLYGGIKLLFCIKTKVRIGLIIFLLWIVALFAFIGMGIYHTTSLFHWRTTHESLDLPEFKSDTLYVDIPQKYYTEGELESVFERVNEWSFFHHKRNNHNKNFCHSSKGKNKTKYSQNKAFDVDNELILHFYGSDKKSAEKLLLLPIVEGWNTVSESNFSIDIHKDAAGSNTRHARRHASEIPFNYTLNDSLLIIEPLVYTENKKWDGELLRLHFQVPKGKKVVFGKAFKND